MCILYTQNNILHVLLFLDITAKNNLEGIRDMSPISHVFEYLVKNIIFS